jgi:hypothetical protein
LLDRVAFTRIEGGSKGKRPFNQVAPSDLIAARHGDGAQVIEEPGVNNSVRLCRRLLLGGVVVAAESVRAQTTMSWPWGVAEQD